MRLTRKEQKVLLPSIYPIACLSSSRWTGMDSFPKKRLMIGRLFANLSFTSISRTSVGSETKLNSYKTNKQKPKRQKREKVKDLFCLFQMCCLGSHPTTCKAYIQSSLSSYSMMSEKNSKNRLKISQTKFFRRNLKMNSFSTVFTNLSAWISFSFGFSYYTMSLKCGVGRPENGESNAKPLWEVLKAF